MDIASLRSELETHLKSNPHAEAPDGFRDRFDQWLEEYEAEEDAELKEKLAALLHRVRDEAEAAAKAGMAEGTDHGGGADAGGGTDTHGAADAGSGSESHGAADTGAGSDSHGAADTGGAASRPEPAPASGAGASYGLIVIVVAIAVAAVAYFYFRG